MRNDVLSPHNSWNSAANSPRSSLTSMNKSMVPDSHVLSADAAGPSLYTIWKLAAPNLSSVFILINGPSN